MLPPFVLCPYCGHDLPSPPASGPCSHCDRIANGLEWTALASRRSSDLAALRSMYLTLLGIALTVAILVTVAEWQKHRSLHPMALMLFGISALLVIAMFWSHTSQTIRRTEWTFRTADGWHGIARGDGSKVAYAEGRAQIAGDTVPSTRVVSAAALPSWETVVGLDDAAMDAASAVIVAETNGSAMREARIWLPAFVSVMRFAAEGEIDLFRQAREHVGWSRLAGESPRAEPATKFAALVATHRGLDASRHHGFDARLLAAIARRAVPTDNPGGYRDAAVPSYADVATAVDDAYAVGRDDHEPLPAATLTQDAPEFGAIVSALRAFIAADRETAELLWVATAEPEEWEG